MNSQPPSTTRAAPWLSLLEQRLLWVALAGLLPLALLSSFTLLQSARAHKEQLIQSAQDTMRAVITAVDAELRLSAVSLETLANSPRLIRGDTIGFHAEAQDLLAKRSNWTNIAMGDRNAQVMNARQAADMAPAPLVDQQLVYEVFKTRAPVIGNIVYGPRSKQPGFGVAVPVTRGGEVVMVLTAVVRPEAILDVILKQNIPIDGAAAILDRNNIIVARSKRQEESVGRSASAALIQMLSQGQLGGWGQTRNLEGIAVYTAFHRSQSTGWTAVVGMPSAMLDAPVRRSFFILSCAILVSVLAGLAAAFLVGRRIVQPMRELEAAAIAIGQGRTPVMPRTDLPEIRRVAFALEASKHAQEAALETERNAKEVERQARVIAEESNHSKDELLAMLGHELRNPLAAISAASQLLEKLGSSEDPSAKTKSDRAREIVARQARHLGRITDDLLNAGGIMKGKVQLDRKPVELSQIVRNALSGLTPERTAGREFEIELRSVWIDADASRIDQVVTNLIGNALKYTPAPGHIEIALTAEGGQAVLRVSDTGIGIEPELLPRVFDLFVQGERSMDRAEGGMGIGLAVVRRLTELHGGRVQARSEGPGRGSEFTVSLPEIPAPHAVPPTTSTTTSKKRKVVIVEDLDEVRSMLREWLQAEGHEVIEACDGPSGIDTVIAQTPDVALVDIGLPGADGYAVARAVRAKLGNKVRLVAMSGYGQQEDKDRGILAGFDAYLVKPVDPQELTNTLVG